jgi:hypothetical protein
VTSLLTGAPGVPPRLGMRRRVQVSCHCRCRLGMAALLWGSGWQLHHHSVACNGRPCHLTSRPRAPGAARTRTLAWRTSPSSPAHLLHCGPRGRREPVHDAPPTGRQGRTHTEKLTARVPAHTAATHATHRASTCAQNCPFTHASLRMVMLVCTPCAFNHACQHNMTMAAHAPCNTVLC